MLYKNIFNKNLPTIKQLQCFLAVAEELNFRKAAELLNITQPPLTRQIKCLEHIIGESLFIRDTHNVSLTPAGKEFRLKVEHIILELELLISSIKHHQSEIRLGYTRIINFENIPEIFTKIKKISINSNDSSHDLTSQQLLKNLMENKLDIALVGEKNFTEQNKLKFKWLYREPLSVILPSTHRASINDKILLDEINDLPLFWFARNENTAFYDKCEKIFKTLPFKIKKIKEPKDSLTLLDQISKGKAFTLLPKSFCIFFREGLSYKNMHDKYNEKLNIDIYVAIRSNETNKNIIDAFNYLGNNI